jgi:hypothetical protein
VCAWVFAFVSVFVSCDMRMCIHVSMCMCV